MILNGFQKNHFFQNRYVALETPSRLPPPFMANTIINFHFDYLNTYLRCGGVRCVCVCGGGCWSGVEGGLVGRQMVEVRDLSSISFCRTESPSHYFCKLEFLLFSGLTDILLAISKLIMMKSGWKECHRAPLYHDLCIDLVLVELHCWPFGGI